MSRGVTLNHTTALVTEDCYSCGVLFAMPKDLRDRRVNDHKSFYCPNGHSMSFTGETDEEKKIKQLERSLKWSRESEASTQRQLESTRKQRTALKGQLTKVKKRVGNGVCPCCNRSFADLKGHMDTKHPDFKLTVVPEEASDEAKV